MSFEGAYLNEFTVSTCLRQRDFISQALFNIALESVVRQALNKAKRIKISYNNQLAVVIAYADDIVRSTENEGA